MKIKSCQDQLCREPTNKYWPGHNMMKFHVPNNVSSYIKCSSESACKEKDVVAGFAAWYSCPVCAYRTVSPLHVDLRNCSTSPLMP